MLLQTLSYIIAVIVLGLYTISINLTRQKNKLTSNEDIHQDDRFWQPDIWWIVIAVLVVVLIFAIWEVV
jgi:cell division protein FtsW (lipid II flippase)